MNAGIVEMFSESDRRLGRDRQPNGKGGRSGAVLELTVLDRYRDPRVIVVRDADAYLSSVVGDGIDENASH